MTMKQVKSLLISGWIVIGAFFGLFLLWAAIAKVESASISPGTIIVESTKKSIHI